MKKWLILTVLLPAGLWAQESAQIFGYVESQFTLVNMADAWQQMQSNKLRLDIESSLSDAVSLGANVNFITYHGTTQWPVLDLLPKTVRGEAVTMTLPGIEFDPYVLPFENRQYLDNAWVKLAFDRFDITVGRQQLSFGSGYAWNPTDIFNIKDVLDPTYEQPGHNAFRFDMPLCDAVNLTAVYAPESDWERSARMLQLKATVGHFDVGLVGAWYEMGLHDFTRLDLSGLNPDFVLERQKHMLAGLHLSGELLGLGVWSEAARHQLRHADDYLVALAGLDYTFDNGSYVMAEYHHEGSSPDSREDYTLNDWMRFLAAEKAALAQDQIYALALFPAGDVVKLGCSVIHVISDGSLAVIPTLNWVLLENVELTAYGNVYSGHSNAVYNANLGNGALARVKVFF